MNNRPIHFILLFLFLLLFSCSRENEILIPDNTAPPDPTVENIVKENYVNRAYIALLGRKPSTNEYSSAFQTLDQGNLSVSSREQMLNTIIGNPEYSYNLYVQSNSLLLEGIDTTEIKETILIYNLLLQDSTYQAIWSELQNRLDQMDIILEVPQNLEIGNLTVAQMQQVLVDNFIYDEINMGSLNFVISVFQNLLQRFPTSDELDQGVLMVEGFSANIFLENGNSRTDFLNIFFNSKDYSEGQVRYIFSRFLFREPGSSELTQYTVDFYNSGNYGQMMVSLLSTDEYVGIE